TAIFYKMKFTPYGSERCLFTSGGQA
ncbi:hypothetical protein LTSEJOH_1695, partial [Salmonella enterica subsp. enterica serovar Johannesburg str. S5-703]